MERKKKRQEDREKVKREKGKKGGVSINSYSWTEHAYSSQRSYLFTWYVEIHSHRAGYVLSFRYFILACFLREKSISP